MRSPARGVLIALPIAAALWAMIGCAAAHAQLSGVTTTTDLSGVNLAVANAQATASAAQAAIPPGCTSAPAMDTTNGSVGNAAGCTPASDATRPANVQLAVATATVGTVLGTGAIVTASDGSFSGYWPRAWANVPGYAHAEIYGTATPYICMIVTTTVTTVSGKCSQVVSTALPGTLLALGATIVNPLGAAPAGLTVRVIGRQ